MKKIMIIVMILLCTLTVYGEESDVTIVIEGEMLTLDLPTYIIDGRTLVPVRFLFEPLGLDVKWDPERFVAIGEKDGLYIEMPIGSVKASVNGVTTILDRPAQIFHNRTYVPLRFVAETTGMTVGWDAASRTISIDKDNNHDHEKLLKTIYDDSHDYNGPNYDVIRSNYKRVALSLETLKKDYLSQNDEFEKELYRIGASLGLIFTNESNEEMMKEIHERLLKTYKNAPIDKNAIKDGYKQLIYDHSYQYTYFDDYKKEDYVFYYNNFLYGYSIGLMPYDSNLKDGYGYIIYYEDEHKGYEQYVSYKDDEIDDLDYTVYRNGIETYDDPTIVNDIVAKIEPNGTLSILPQNASYDSFKTNTGMGYIRFPSGVEYVGYLDDIERTLQGYYFGEDDDNVGENLLDLRLDEILESLSLEDLTEDEQVKLIHDYLIDHITYDTSINPMSHTAYGAVIQGDAVCDGYAESFKYLLDKLGFENDIIIGEGQEDGQFIGSDNHAWNYVVIDDVGYYFDLTWNNDDDNQRVKYTYYKKDKQFFEQTHQWEE